LDDAGNSKADYELGQRVRVRLNERNRTPHTGVVAQKIWHHNREQYFYWLTERGRTVHKRYTAEDLESVGPPHGDPADLS
jgi:hypothetical protein